MWSEPEALTGADLPDQSRCANVGYLAAGVYHPGDALALPPRAVDTVLVPIQASWLSTAAAVDFLRHVDHQRAVGIHDGQVDARGVSALNRWLEVGSPGRCAYLASGASVEVGS